MNKILRAKGRFSIERYEEFKVIKEEKERAHMDAQEDKRLKES